VTYNHTVGEERVMVEEETYIHVVEGVKVTVVVGTCKYMEAVEKEMVEVVTF